MKTEIVKILQPELGLSCGEDAALRRAGAVLRAGGLVAFPTETVYGLGGDGLNRESARKIYEAKGRPSDNPLIIHICRFEDIYEIAGAVPKEAEKLADAFWPGPLTMILPKSAQVPYETTGGLDTVAVRFPSHPVARKLIEYGGRYIAAPSANRSGKPSPTEAGHVAEDMDGRVDMIVDGGAVGIGLESTIVDLTVDLTKDRPQILRPGYVTERMLTEVLGAVDTDVTIIKPGSGQAPKAPGMKYRHYAPEGELVLVEGEPERVAAYVNEQAAADRARGCKTGVIAASETEAAYRADVVKCLGSRSDEESIARGLFAALREFDNEKVTKIYSESFPDRGLGQAIMNRLLKAAGHRVVRV